MPYAPVLDSRAGDYIMRGAEQASRGIAAGIEAMQKSQREEDYLSGLAPYYFGDKPELLKKFTESNLGGKRGMITAAQADEAHQQKNMENQFREADINARYYGIDTDANIARERMQYDADKFRAEMKASQPQPMQLGEERMYYTPRTGNIIRQRKPIAAPNGQSEIPVYDGPNNTGTIVAKRLWDPIKGVYDTVDVRPRASNGDALGALLGGSGTTAPAAPKSGSTAPAQPSIPAVPAPIKSKAEFDALPAGAEFIGPDGKKYRK